MLDSFLGDAQPATLNQHKTYPLLARIRDAKNAGTAVASSPVNTVVIVATSYIVT